MSDHTRSIMTRRGVLKGATAVGAMAALAPSLLRPGAAHAQGAGTVMSGSHWGVFTANVEDGTWKSVAPWAGDPHPSHQLEGVMDSVYSPSRIKYPMVRKAYLEGGPAPRPKPAARMISSA